MQTSPPIRQTSLKIIAAVFATVGFALVVTSFFSLVACSAGLLFSGISNIFTVFVTVAVCTVAIPVTALIFRRRQRHFGWRTLFTVVSCLSLLGVGLLSLLQTRQTMQIFFNPMPVPNGVHVHQGRSVLFSSYVHFSAPPAVIAALIRSKEMVEAPTESPDSGDISAYNERQRTIVSWDWWQPSTMSKPKFFFRHHTSEAIQGWSEGWWVNSDTNEVYALISG
jgi:hypothetical protein